MKASRKTKIISILEEENSASVKSLAETLNVSEMTIRRDLAELEKSNITKLKHGIAKIDKSLASNSDVNNKLYNVDIADNSMINEKLRIVDYAASLVSEGSTIIIDNGTTMDLLGSALNKDRPLTVVTPNLRVANQLVDNRAIELTLTGGLYHHETAMFEGTQAIEILKQVRANIGFVSALAIQGKMGITCSKPYEILLKQAIIKSSFKRILLADSSKFNELSSYHFAYIEDFDMIISDKGLPEDFIQLIKGKDVELILV